MTRGAFYRVRKCWSLSLTHLAHPFCAPRPPQSGQVALARAAQVRVCARPHHAWQHVSRFGFVSRLAGQQILGHCSAQIFSVIALFFFSSKTKKSHSVPVTETFVLPCFKKNAKTMSQRSYFWRQLLSDIRPSDHPTIRPSATIRDHPADPQSAPTSRSRC